MACFTDFTRGLPCFIASTSSAMYWLARRRSSAVSLRRCLATAFSHVSKGRGETIDAHTLPSASQRMIIRAIS
jgi:hypothetical protein